MTLVTAGYVAEPEGTCTLTGDIVNGPFIRSPYVVTTQFVDRPFYLGAPTIRAFATSIGLVEEAPLLEEIDKRDATIEDLSVTVKMLQGDIAIMKVPAERYWAMISSEDGTDFEKQILERDAHIAKLQAQLAKYTTDAKKEKAAA